MTHRATIEPTEHHPWTLTSDPTHVSVRRRHYGDRCQYRRTSARCFGEKSGWALFPVCLYVHNDDGGRRVWEENVRRMHRRYTGLYLSEDCAACIVVWSLLGQKGLCLSGGKKKKKSLSPIFPHTSPSNLSSATKCTLLHLQVKLIHIPDGHFIQKHLTFEWIKVLSSA